METRHRQGKLTETNKKTVFFHMRNQIGGEFCTVSENHLEDILKTARFAASQAKTVPFRRFSPFSQFVRFSRFTISIKMKTAVLASLIASAAAFAPAKQAAKTSAVASSFEDTLGAQAPLGLWDPLGLLNGADEERFDRLRYVEIKHGRISKFL